MKKNIFLLSLIIILQIIHATTFSMISDSSINLKINFDES